MKNQDEFPRYRTFYGKVKRKDISEGCLTFQRFIREKMPKIQAGIRINKKEFNRLFR